MRVMGDYTEAMGKKRTSAKIDRSSGHDGKFGRVARRGPLQGHGVALYDIRLLQSDHAAKMVRLSILGAEKAEKLEADGEHEKAARVREQTVVRHQTEGLPDITDLPWLLVCEKHRDSDRFADEAQAQAAIGRSDEWCIGCTGREQQE